MGEVLTRIEGDPFEVSAAGTALSSIAADVTTQARRLRSLAMSGWTGVAADRAHAHLATLPTKLDKVAASYGAAGAALGSYARALANAQSESDDAIAAAARASTDLAAAQAARSAAALSDAVAARAAIAGTLPPAPATAHRYDAAIEDAGRRLNAARTSNGAAHSDQRHSASGAAAALQDASRQGIRHQNWWHHVTSAAGHWAATHWVGVLRGLASVATKVATIASIAVLVLAVGGIFFPPLEIAAAAMEGVTIAADAVATLETVTAVTSGVSMVADSTLAATGNGRWLAPAEDALDLAPWRAGTAISAFTPEIRAASKVRVVGRLIANKVPTAPMADFGDGAGGRRFPLGFRDSSRFRGFARVVRRSLDNAGHQAAEPAMQGSSVTGFKFETTIPFDGGLERSDHDIVIASSELLARAKAAGVGMRSMGPALRHVRTEPLTLEHNRRHLQILGLDQVAKDASKAAGREVGFMIYESSELAFARRPTIAIRP